MVRRKALTNEELTQALQERVDLIKVAQDHAYALASVKHQEGRELEKLAASKDHTLFALLEAVRVLSSTEEV